MRADMQSVWCETYRSGPRGNLKPGRPPRDLEDLPVREGIRVPYSRNWGVRGKDSNNNYQVLDRWLVKQVGRPWNEVYSEVCRTLDRRNTVAHNILDRIKSQVARTGLYIDEAGVVMEMSSYGSVYPVGGLYAHPDSGLLLNAVSSDYRDYQRQRKKESQLELEARRRIISETEQLHKVGDSWFILTLAPVKFVKEIEHRRIRPNGQLLFTRYADPETLNRDVFLNRYVEFGDYLLRNEYGKAGMYAKAKRQASHKELRNHGVV